MKKYLFLFVAMLAAIFSSCKHETTTIYVTNSYSAPAVVLISADKDCSDPELADLVIPVDAGKSVATNKGVKIKGMHAVVFTSEGTTLQGDPIMKRVVSFDLNEFYGMATITITIKSNGLPSIEGSSM